jgi:hypothetical protein
VTELAVNRLRSMATTVLENVHLGDALVCTGSSAISTVFVVFCFPLLDDHPYSPDVRNTSKFGLEVAVAV